jgi:DNA-directed RNA polymerase alpha subunit
MTEHIEFFLKKIFLEDESFAKEIVGDNYGELINLFLSGASPKNIALVLERKSHNEVRTAGFKAINLFADELKKMAELKKAHDLKTVSEEYAYTKYNSIKEDMKSVLNIVQKYSKDNSVIEKTIEECGFSTLLKNALKRNDINTVSQAAELMLHETVRIGPVAERELKDYFKVNKLSIQ